MGRQAQFYKRRVQAWAGGHLGRAKNSWVTRPLVRSRWLNTACLAAAQSLPASQFSIPIATPQWVPLLSTDCRPIERADQKAR